jgi:hypothetical protein
VQWLFLIVEPTRLFLGEPANLKLDMAQGYACYAAVSRRCCRASPSQGLTAAGVHRLSGVLHHALQLYSNSATLSIDSSLYAPSHVAITQLAVTVAIHEAPSHPIIGSSASWFVLGSPATVVFQTQHVLCCTVNLSNSGACYPAGSKGNKTEQSGPLMFCVLLACPMIAFFVYFLQYQTYV